MHNYGQNPGIYYYVNDHLGAPQQLITATGLVVWQAAYLPYGEAQVRINLVENNLRFPGQYFDAESGLHYNWNRYYDAQTGRYISADPIGLEGGMNVYAYVGGNPVNGIDPEGLSYGDVELMVRVQMALMQDLNNRGRRFNSSSLNGFLGFMHGYGRGLQGKEWDSHWLSCGDQADLLVDALERMRENGAFDDRWYFYADRWPWHITAEARSKNPKDPQVTLDPWKGTVEIKHSNK